MVIRLDGQVLNDVSLSDTINGSANCAGQNPFQQPHYILLNLALGGAGEASTPGLPDPLRSRLCAGLRPDLSAERGHTHGHSLPHSTLPE